MSESSSKARLQFNDCVQSSEFAFIGFDASNPTVAHIKIPLMHVGANAKGLYWTPEVLTEIAPMFSNTTFKYDLEGKEGSSHVPDKLYSPHFDVGWTSKAYYDKGSKTLWVEGDVTHPDVVSKLHRATPTGKRELNYASMGVLIDPDDVSCSICGKNMTDCGHKRNELYGGKTAYAIPTRVEKALHVALTNAPADTEAVIAEAIFQEARNLRGETMADGPAGVGATDSYTNQQSRPNTLTQKQVQPQQNVPISQYQKDQAGQSMMAANPTDQKAKTNDAVGAMAAEDMPLAAPEAAPVTPGEGDDDVEIVDVLKAIIMRLQAIEEKIGAGAAAPTGPEAAPMGAPPMGGAPTPPTEMADIAGKYYKKMLSEVADKSVHLGRYNTKKEAIAHFQDRSIEQLEALGDAFEGIEVKKQRVEVASMPEFGTPRETKATKTFADLSASERKNKFGEYASWDMCFRNPNAQVE